MSGKILRGKVISTKMNKTISVSVEAPKISPKYGKRYINYKKYLAHDESSVAKEGDVVMIIETRPISKSKKWKLEKVISVKKA
jgi:small subunit ribosomal protein S17